MNIKIRKNQLNIKELENQLEEGEHLQFLFISNIKLFKNNGERGLCKNGHVVTIPYAFPFEDNTHTIIQCEQCNEIVMEFKPFAIRNRLLVF